MSDRDTHFLGFAKLLFREIKEEWSEDLSFDATLHKIIAQHTYDLMYSLLEIAHQHRGTFAGEIQQSIKLLPDLTEWPKLEKTE